MVMNLPLFVFLFLSGFDLITTDTSLSSRSSAMLTLEHTSTQSNLDKCNIVLSTGMRHTIQNKCVTHENPNKITFCFALESERKALQTNSTGHRLRTACLSSSFVQEVCLSVCVCWCLGSSLDCRQMQRRQPDHQTGCRFQGFCPQQFANNAKCRSLPASRFSTQVLGALS